MKNESTKFAFGRSRFLAVLMVALVLLVAGLLSTTATYADSESDGFVINDGVLTSYTGSETSVTIPDGVTTIGSGTKNASVFPSTVKEVIMPSSVTKIAAYAFYNSSSITKITLSENLSEIGKYAFYSAKGITYLEFPSSMRTIGEGAFMNATGLTSVDLNQGLETIGEYAFSVSRVSGITIPESVQTIGDAAFDYEYGGDLYIVISGANTKLEGNAIPYYYNLAVYAPEGSQAESYVKNMQTSKGSKCKMSFYSINDFVEATDITLSQESVTLQREETETLTASPYPSGSHMPNVSWSSDNTDVATVNANGKVTAGNTGTATITASVGSIVKTCTVTVAKAEGESDFTINANGEVTGYLGTIPEEIEIPEEVNGTAVTGIADKAFANQTGLVKVTLPSCVTKLGAQAFSGCSSLTDINLNYVTEFGKKALSSTKITKVTLAEGVTEIPEGLFQSCSSLTKVNLPDTLEKIGDYAFSSCGSLSRITLNEGLKTIGTKAFYKVPLKTLHLPSTFENMGDKYMGDVFEEAGKDIADKTMKNITVDGDNPNYMSVDGILYSKDGSTVVFCPKGRTSAKVAAGTEKIGDYAFFMCFDLETVTLPSSLKTVGKHAFQYDEGLLTCELPEGLETLEEAAFFGAENWDGVDRIPSTVRTIDAYAFAECKGSKLTIPEGVTEIGEYAFWGYEVGLIEINLPSTLKTIGNFAFSWAKDVKTLTIPEGVTFIGKQAFARTDSLETLTLPSTLTTIGDEAFMGKEGSNQLAKVTLPDSLETLGTNVFKNRTDTVVYAQDLESTAAKTLTEEGMTVKQLVKPLTGQVVNLKAKAKSKTKETLTWSKVKGATGYEVYVAKNGKSLKKVKNTKSTSYIKTGLKKGTTYKYQVKAYQTIDGKKVTLGTSYVAYGIAGGFNSKYTDAKTIKATKKSLTVSTGKTATVKAKLTKVKKGKKFLKSSTVKPYRFKTSDSSVATVSKSGKVTGKKAGTATIYVSAQNGIWTSVKVTVK